MLYAREDSNHLVDAKKKSFHLYERIYLYVRIL